MDDFNTIRFKKNTIKRFKRFSKKITSTYSDTLEVMMDFFEENGVSPNESIGPQMQTLESLIKKRINGVIAIMKDIEKNQTKPTVAMMHSLFEQEPEKKKTLLLEKKEFMQEKQPKYQEKKNNNS